MQQAPSPPPDTSPPKPTARAIHFTILVAALGYFVDIYDLLLFGIVRVDSLRTLGLDGEDLKHTGIFLVDMQMIGMLIGGVLWGILGDKRGRLTVLFGSILLYSTANILNGFVQDVPTYAALRFVAGLGLAGELGAGITLVAELMSKEKRGLGTTFIAGLGLMGAVVASLVAGYNWNLGIENWRVAYFVGGGMGFLLLLLRVSVRESGLFHAAKQTGGSRGNFGSLFTSSSRLRRFVVSIGIGIPVWFSVGVLIMFANNFGPALGMAEVPSPATAIMLAYAGISLGDVACGLLSQALKSRKQALTFFMLANTLTVFYYLFGLQGATLTHYYAVCFCIGLSTGYWAVFVTVAAEQFGTNLRATVTTSVPNFVRGAVVPITLGYGLFSARMGEINGALVVGLVCFLIGGVSLWLLQETFHKDLDYLEQ